MNRRRFIAGTGCGIAVSLGGCLGFGDDQDPEETPDQTPIFTAETDTPVNQSDLDPDSFSIDGRFHNETTRTLGFEISAYASGQLVLTGESEVDPETTVRVPGIGDPGQTLRYEVTVDGNTLSKTLTPGGDSPDGDLDGFIEIRYAGENYFEIVFESAGTETPTGDPERPYVDEPPYEITVPEKDTDEYDEEYLGAEMPTTPSLDFETFSLGSDSLRGESPSPMDGDFVWTQIVTSENDRDNLFDMEGLSDEKREQLEAVDFEDSILVAVESGFRSGSVDHRWARAEETDAGVHLHGYYTDPNAGTDDVTTILSVLKIERPSVDNPQSVVSFTLSPDRRVNFDSTNGVVTSLSAE